MCVGETRNDGARVDYGSVYLYAENDVCVAAEQRANTRDLRGRGYKMKLNASVF